MTWSWLAVIIIGVGFWVRILSSPNKPYVIGSRSEEAVLVLPVTMTHD